MIKLENLSKYYKSETNVTLGLSKINLELYNKEFIAITGESGSGKSTLLNVISGIDSYEEGELYFILEDNKILYDECYNVFQRARDSFLNDINFLLATFVILAGILFTASLIFLYFIIRSSLISRIYEIGVYRAIGVTKKDIRKIFIAEILLISLFSSIFGWVIAWYFINKLGYSVGLLLPIHISFLSITLIFICNIFFGLKLVTNLLKLTPSEIGSKYDI